MSRTGESVRIVKQIGAPVGLVFEAFIEPEQLVRWMHPDQFRGVSASNDPTVGGRGEMTHAEGSEVVGGFTWQYTEIVENRRLVMDWQFVGLGQESGDDHSRMTIDLREAGPDSTEVILTHDRLGEAPPGGYDGVDTGWTQALESLQRHFEENGEESK